MNVVRVMHRPLPADIEQRELCDRCHEHRPEFEVRCDDPKAMWTEVDSVLTLVGPFHFQVCKTCRDALVGW